MLIFSVFILYFPIKLKEVFNSTLNLSIIKTLRTTNNCVSNIVTESWDTLHMEEKIKNLEWLYLITFILSTLYVVLAMIFVYRSIYKLCVLWKNKKTLNVVKRHSKFEEKAFELDN